MNCVCIGVHVHAEPERLHTTLKYLREHTSMAFDLLLLPDGPDEATKAVLNTLRDVPQSGTVEPLGAPSCFNRLITSTSADIVVFLESGILVGPQWLEYLLAALATDPRNGLAGPSTNRSWNEQGVFPRAGGTPAEVVYTAKMAKSKFGNETRTLEPLYSLGDFCYLVRREVIDAIGLADEGYGLGPCWEMDYNVRAARKGFRGVWACVSYVHRAPFTARRQREEKLRFEESKQLYQDRFCGLRLRGEKSTYEAHCRGEDCPHFAPIELIQVRLQNGRLDKRDQQTKASEAATDQTSVLPVRKQSDVPPSDITSIEVSPHIRSTDTLPLVSCIMPTRNRRTFIQQALTYFERQDYPNKELIIVDDGDDQVADLVSSRPYVRYVPLAQKMSIGAKRNLACQQASGTIIAHWDDDDWYAPHRLTHQVVPLLADQADITGLETFCFFDIPHWQVWSCSPELHKQLFVGDVHGGTLVYHRFVWERLAKYPNVSLAEDAYFLRAACRQRARLLKLPHAHSFVYLRHEHNAWSFPLGTYLNPSGWQLIDPNTCIPEDDLPFYSSLSPLASLSAAQNMESQENTAHPQQTHVVLFSSAELPLVSCIMPTYNRRHYVPQAILYFLRQEYPNRELLIVDDGSEPVADLVPADPRIRYIRLDTRMILGAKRNLACKLAQGTIIAHWDDDDWMAPHRLHYQVDALEREKADLCGAGRQLYYSPAANQAWLYEYPATIRRWLAGNTLCYRKGFWETNHFPDRAIGEDTHFAWSPKARNAVVVPEHTFYVGLVHEVNTSRKNVRGNYWHSHSVEEIQRLLGADMAFYRP